MSTFGRRALFVVMCASVFTLASCSGTEPAVVEQSGPGGDTTQPVSGADTASTSAAETSTSVAETSDAVVSADLVDLVGGGQLDLNSIEGSDTVLWFWAPW